MRQYKIEKVKQSYCIISLGKLGGSELNYSSDIDIIIFYDKENKIGNKYYSEILSETIQLYLTDLFFTEPTRKKSYLSQLLTLNF